MVRHSSLESLERTKCDTQLVTPPKPRKKEVELSDHIQFLITEKSPSQACSSVDVVRDTIDDGDVLSEGNLFIIFFTKKIKKKKISFHRIQRFVAEQG